MMLRWSRSGTSSYVQVHIFINLLCQLVVISLVVLQTSDGGTVIGISESTRNDSKIVAQEDEDNISDEEISSDYKELSSYEDYDEDEFEDEDYFDYDNNEESKLETDRKQNGEQKGWLPKIYGMLRSTFNFGKQASGKPQTFASSAGEEDEYEDEILSDEELLDYNDLELEEDLDSGEKSDALDDVREILGLSRNSATNDTAMHTNLSQGRQFFPMPMYMLQGIYLVEPRLNPYIDGVLKNLGSEIKISGIDPLHYRVLPRGRVASRITPQRRGPQLQQKRKPAVKRRRRRPFFGRMWRPGNRRRVNQKKRKPAVVKKRKGLAGKNVGLGRVDGLSKLVRDGSTEMQSQTADGNYTLVRSHFNLGPLDLAMQFRTVRGIRRAATTIHKVRVHTVTRVSNEGSEMMDFMLDRPHPETIQVRGKLFPLAQRVARNVFSRLFANDSFLVARIREKTGMALLSKPTQSAG